ncbi:hypothetical protein B0H14DRAFT_2564342 [Mycena olivaceomarginata]|nr:hypothetical protein B0H14DRAFT_2564342 [Mycena olivaceomarginata]
MTQERHTLDHGGTTLAPEGTRTPRATTASGTQPLRSSETTEGNMRYKEETSLTCWQCDMGKMRVKAHVVDSLVERHMQLEIHQSWKPKEVEELHKRPWDVPAEKPQVDPQISTLGSVKEVDIGYGRWRQEVAQIARLDRFGETATQATKSVKAGQARAGESTNSSLTRVEADVKDANPKGTPHMTIASDRERFQSGIQTAAKEVNDVLYGGKVVGVDTEIPPLRGCMQHSGEGRQDVLPCKDRLGTRMAEHDVDLEQSAADCRYEFQHMGCTAVPIDVENTPQRGHCPNVQKPQLAYKRQVSSASIESPSRGVVHSAHKKKYGCENIGWQKGSRRTPLLLVNKPFEAVDNKMSNQPT